MNQKFPHEVGCIAIRGIFRVVEAQAGAMAVAIYVQENFSKFAHIIAQTAINAAHDIAKGAKHPTQAGPPVVISLDPVHVPW